MDALLTTVADVVHRLEGAPPVDKPAPFTAEHVCGNCLHRRLAAPANKVLTSQFGTWDDIAADVNGKRWLCVACAWAYRATGYRRAATLITPDHAHHPTWTQLRETLTRPIPHTVAIVVPLSGKRLVLPRAQWGRVAVDGATITWTPALRTQMLAATRLRTLGVIERALPEPSPPFAVLTSTPPDQHDTIRSLWRVLDPARGDKRMLTLMQKLSREAA